MINYQELKLAFADMHAQQELYKPTSFWSKASQLIADEIEKNGVEKFRSLNSTLNYFVPTYGLPGNSFTKEMSEALQKKLKDEYSNHLKPQLALQQFLTGEMAALSDYRAFVAADTKKHLPHLHTFSESTFGNPVEQFEFEGKKFSRSALNYLLGLALLKKHLNGYFPKTVLEIGGGFGTLGEILSKSGIDQLKYIDIDIPPTSFVAQHYLSNLLGESNVATYSKTKELSSIEIDSLPSASVLCSWQIEKLRGQVDLFVNFISFQEMEPAVVKNYLSQVTRLNTKWILLRNMREGKNKRTDNHSVGVETPILSEDYTSMLNEYELVDRNVIPFGYKTVDNFHSELLLFKRKNERL
jgi:putative sugar O-methyltransferase